MTELVHLDADSPDPEQIAGIGARLAAGALVAFPTETVYGLGAAITDPDALVAVFRAKGRPRTDPLIVHVESVSRAASVVEDWPDGADALADRFWPGPLTMVLRRSETVPDEVTAGGPTVGVRVPAHPVASALIAAAGVPVAAPSANRFGRVSPTEAGHVLEELSGRIDVVLDAGPTPLGIESTVIDLTVSPPRVLRHGGVSVEDLAAVVGPVSAPERVVVDDHDVASAPGQLLRHYAPSTPLVLVEPGPQAAIELVARLAGSSVRAAVVDLPRDPDRAASALYRSLRVADRGDADLLLAGVVTPEGIGRAVNDRLFRAAHGRLVVGVSEDAVRRLARWAAP